MTKILELTQSIYEAFGTGNIPAIIDMLADDVKWDIWENNSAQDAGVPWLQGGIGKQIALDYFGVVGTLNFKKFAVKSIMINENQSAVAYEIEFEYPITGKTYKDEPFHFWTFNEQGKVINFRHICDTGQMIEVIKK